MASVTPRLARRIEHDFPDEAVDEIVLLVTGASDSERVQGAIVLAAGGDMQEAERQAELAQVDWRDVLVSGGLAAEHWASVLDHQLGR